MSTSPISIGSAILVSALTTAGIANQALTDVDKTIGSIEGRQLVTIAQAGQLYALKNMAALLSATSANLPPGVSIPSTADVPQGTTDSTYHLPLELSLTSNDMKSYLDANVSNPGDYRVILERLPKGCKPVAATGETPCSELRSVAWSKNPAVSGGKTNLNIVSAAQSAGKGFVGISSYGNPNTVRFMDPISKTYTASLPNPMGNRMGVMVASANTGASPYSQYLRLDGTSKMAGQLQMNNNDITGAKNLTANGLTTLNANTLNADGKPAGLIIEQSGSLNGKVLTSDSNGRASWKDTVATATSPDDYSFPSSTVTTITGSSIRVGAPYRYTGMSIDLKPGTWIVRLNLTIVINNWTTQQRSGWIHARWSDDASSCAASPDKISPSGTNLVSYAATVPLRSKYILLAGDMFMKNKADNSGVQLNSGEKKRYYLCIGDLNSEPDSLAPWDQLRFEIRGDAWETVVYAHKIANL